MTIKAAVMTAPNSAIEMWDIPSPEIEDGGVLLETVASEVCGTDVHLHHGKLAGVPYPIIPGHVSVGRVIEARGVTADFNGSPLHKGDVVTFYDVHEICGECWFCLVAKQPNRCPHRKVYGITYSAHDGPLGGWSEQIYLKPGVKIFKIPEGLTADDIIGGGCGLFTGFAAVDRANVRMGDRVIVQGTGAVGLCAINFAAVSGASTIVAIGDPDSRLALASEMGADETFSVSATSKEERRDRIMELSDGRGFDVVIEATGHPTAVPEGMNLTRDAGTYVVVGHYTDAGTVPINPHLDINRKHINVLGQWGTDLGHISRALTVVGKTRPPLARIAGATYSIQDAQKALEDVRDLKVTKAIITP
jgi:D-arabinose 1-dehydrogenase-like Zn-dependent alcohol dehydrogenase